MREARCGNSTAHSSSGVTWMRRARVSLAAGHRALRLMADPERREIAASFVDPKYRADASGQGRGWRVPQDGHRLTKRLASSALR